MTAPYAPTWLAPSAPGQLSNRRGTNTGSDGIGFKARQLNPKGVASPLSLIRMQAFRTGVGGNPSASQPAWDSGWVGGNPAVQQLPIAKQSCGGNSSVVYNGRLYFMPSDGTIMSAPVSSAAVGTWRYENPVPAGNSGTAPVVYSMTSVANRLYCTATLTTFLSATATLYMSTINADGTLGNWVMVPGGTVTLSDAIWKNTGILGGWDGVSATGWIIYWHSGVAMFTLAINVGDGSCTAAATTSAGPTVTRDNLTAGIAVTVAGAGLLYLVGGTAAAATSVVDGGPLNLSTGVGGTLVAKQALPAARSGGSLVVLQNGTVYYMGGSSGTTAALATTTVWFNSATGINSSTPWSTSAQVLPAATWLTGGGITMPDYDLLGARGGLADSATEVFTGNALTSNADTFAMASFKALTTIALKASGAGAVATGTNTAVTPAFGSVTVAGNLLIAGVSGSDQTPGVGGNTFGATGGATTSYNFGQTDNEVGMSIGNMPAGGGYINTLYCYCGGYGGTVPMQLCLWNSSGTLLAASGSFTAGSGNGLQSASIGSVFVAGGTGLYVGFYHPTSGGTSGGWAMWGVAGSGSFVSIAGNASGPGNVSWASCGSQGFQCGNMQAYLQYTTPSSQSPITASAGWTLASDSPNGNEEVQIWYKIAAGADAAPTFSSTFGQSVMYAQLLEFTGAVASAPVDSSGHFAQGGAGTSMTASNSAADGVLNDLIITVSRWVTSVAGTATFATSITAGGNTLAVTNAGNTGAASTTRQSSFNYAVAPTTAPPSRAPGVVLCGGQSTGGAPQSKVISAQVNPTGTPNDIYSWSVISGNGTAASVAQLGAGAALLPNPDGTQDVTLPYGGAGTLRVGAVTAGVAADITQGTSYLHGLNDGDQLTVTVQVVTLDGDPSPLAATVVVIGQPPSGVVSLGATGQSTVALAYSPGSGGGPQATWRAQIIGQTTGIIWADTLQRTDLSNFWAPLIAPLLDSSESYTVSVTATSSDVAMDTNSSNSATATATITVSGTAPTAPTGVTVATSAVFCGVVVSWTNPTAGTLASSNRLYYRRSGTLPWYLLRDHLTGLGAAVSMADQLAMGVSYDFAVSAVDPTGSLESSLSSPIILNPGFELPGAAPILQAPLGSGGPGGTLVVADSFETAGASVNLWKSIGTDALGTLAFWTADAGVPTIASNVVTMPISSRMRGGHPDWGDCVVQMRIVWVTGSKPGIELHADSGANCVQCWTDGANIYLWKQVGSAATNVQTTSIALTTATAYWLKLTATGTTYSAQIYSDSAGAINTLLATASGVISDAALQTGQMGAFNGTNGTVAPTAAVTMGGAFAGTCLVTGIAPKDPVFSGQWTPAVQAGEPAFAWSTKQAYYGTRSLSIYNAVAAGSGHWDNTSVGSPNSPYTLTATLWGNGTPSLFAFQATSLTAPVSTVATANSTWQQVNASGTLVVTYLTFYAYGVGTYYCDNVALLLPGSPTNVLFRSIGTDATGTLNAWSQVAGSWSITGNAVSTSSTGGVMVAGHLDWGDSVATLRVQHGPATPCVVVHNDGTALNYIFAFTDGTTLYFYKMIGGTATLVTSVTVTTGLTTGAWYWIRLQAAGTTYTATLYQDFSGFIGSQIAGGQISAVVTDGAVQSGKVGIRNGTGTGVTGGAFSNVLLVQGPVPAGWLPATQGGEPAYAWSKVNPFAGTSSASIYNAHSSAQGIWTNSVGTINENAVTMTGELRGTGAVSTFDISTSLGNTGTAALDGAWHLVTGSVNFSGGGNVVNCVAYGGPGTFYFDNIDLKLTSAASVTIPTPAGGYTAMLHVPGSLTLIAPLMLRGGPTTKESIETVMAEVFGSRAPVVRVGGADYRLLDLTIQEHLAADYPALQKVLAVMRQGTPVYLRTAAGHLLTVALQPAQEIAFLPQAYTSLKTAKLSLVEVPNAYQPSLAQGTARGILSQVGGSAQALDPSELAI